MSTSAAKGKRFWFPVLVILSLLVLFTVGFRVIRYAVGRAGDSFFQPGLKAVTLNRSAGSDPELTGYDREQLISLVTQLRRSNRELAISSTTAAALLEENRQLRQYLALPRPPQWSYSVAEIVLRDPLRFNEGFTIGKGSRNGIAPGDAVAHLTADGRLILVGVIDSCGARSAKVFTLLNPELRLSGRVAGNYAIGFTNSGSLRVAPETIRFGMLPLRDDYVSGEVVTTTGFERGIPEGLKIGELGTVHFAVGAASMLPDFCCELIPAVRFHTLRFVIVIHRLDGGKE